MTIREFGTENDRTLVFFQGSCEPWQEFCPAAQGLVDRFHVMLVTPDGHDPEEQNDFIEEVDAVHRQSKKETEKRV